MVSRKTQQDKVFKHLEERGSITVREMMLLYDINHPTSVIRDLKKKGHIISYEWVKPKNDSPRFKRYYLVKQSTKQ